ncbi:hypothetical protein SAMN04487920_11320 [Bacillus mycoides]|uniref:hypothetical protein n=1 Tax=Bacillus mycoides TaxID=1405 RepID=UPI0008E02D90|nr:hypothetical protein [Bacillus mycoides]SFQ87216.1 hypothetical protein SAMN04487920_11320 [Bacillus mycoides]
MKLKIKDFLMNVWTEISEFFLGVTVYSVQHLGWTTAVVAAILALTAIVFSQYNDRNVTKINEYDYLLRNETNDVKKIRKYISEVVYLLKNTKIYEDTLALFKYVSYFIVFIWIIVIFGYISDAKTSGDSIVIILSTILVSIPFIRLPMILQKFNEKKFDLRIQNNTLDYLDLESYWKELEVKEFDLIKDIINPTVKIKHIEGNIYFEFSSKLVVSNLQIFVTCIHRNRVFKLSHTLKADNKKYMLQLISQESAIETTYDGLFEKLASLKSRQISVYLIPVKDKQNIIAYQGSLLTLNAKEIELQIDSITQDTFTEDTTVMDYFFYSDDKYKEKYYFK